MVEIACRLDEVGRRERVESLAELRSAVTERRELADGFSFRFAGEPGLGVALFEFIEGERGCCPFLSFRLEFTPERGPVWLTIRGPAGAKALIAEFLGDDPHGAREQDGRGMNGVV